MFKRACVLATALVVGMAAPALALTVGVVDLQTLQKTAYVQKAEARIAQTQGTYQQELQKRSQQLEDARKRNASSQELQRMQQQFEKELQTLRSKGEQDMVAAQETLRIEVERAVKAVAAQRKVDLVLRKDAVLFGDATVDITTDVGKKLEALEKS